MHFSDIKINLKSWYKQINIGLKIPNLVRSIVRLITITGTGKEGSELSQAIFCNFENKGNI